MMSQSEPALQRLLRGNPMLRREVEGAIFDFLRKYNSDQPRVPLEMQDSGELK